MTCTTVVKQKDKIIRRVQDLGRLRHPQTGGPCCCRPSTLRISRHTQIDQEMETCLM